MRNFVHPSNRGLLRPPTAFIWALLNFYRFGFRQSLCPLSFSNRNHFDNSSSILSLRGELLNAERFVRCCIGIVLNGPFLTAQNSAIQQYPQCRRLILYGNTAYSVWCILFNGIKARQNHTSADVFLNYLRHFAMIESIVVSLFSHPLIFFPFFRKHFNISHARCSRVRYQSIHESQIIAIS